MQPTRPLAEGDMTVADLELYAAFPTHVDSFSHMAEDMLPPLGNPPWLLPFIP